MKLKRLQLKWRLKPYFVKNVSVVESASEEATLLAEECFRVKYFLYIEDQAISSLKSRFEQFKSFEGIFGFLFDLKMLNFIDDESLKSHCDTLEDKLKHDNLYDIDGRDLYLELKLLKEYLPNETKKAIDVLNYLKRMDGTF